MIGLQSGDFLKSLLSFRRMSRIEGSPAEAIPRVCILRIEPDSQIKLLERFIEVLLLPELPALLGETVGISGRLTTEETYHRNDYPGGRVNRADNDGALPPPSTTRCNSQPHSEQSCGENGPCQNFWRRRKREKR